VTVAGPKIDLAAVQAAEAVVDNAVAEMERVTQQILSQAGLSQAAMKAPAGQVTAATFDDLGGGGRALAEVLGQLKADMGQLRQAALAGSDEATQAAMAGGQAAGIVQGM
jgi:hypothetical protein